MRLLIPYLETPELEVLSADLRVQFKPRNSNLADRYGWTFNMLAYVVPRPTGYVVIPNHRNKGALISDVIGYTHDWIPSFDPRLEQQGFITFAENELIIRGPGHLPFVHYFRTYHQAKEIKAAVTASIDVSLEFVPLHTGKSIKVALKLTPRGWSDTAKSTAFWSWEPS